MPTTARVPFHEVAYTSLTLVSKPQIPVYEAARASASKREKFYRQPGRAPSRAGSGPRRSRIRRSGLYWNFLRRARRRPRVRFIKLAARGRGNRTN